MYALSELISDEEKNKTRKHKVKKIDMSIFIELLEEDNKEHGK